MEERRRAPLGGSGSTKLRAPAVRTEHEAHEARRQAREQQQRLTLPARVKKEDISEVPPLKVPRFQYVDFPSLHQCIQQLTVPPLDNWLAACPVVGRPSGRAAPVGPKERVPKFKYVDFPSLHHCIKQLSVPPIESWSSGLAKPERGSATGERDEDDDDGHGSASQPGSGKGNRPRQDGGGDAAAVTPPTRKQEKYTAFLLTGDEPGSLQCVSTSSHASRKPVVHPTARPKTGHGEGALQSKVAGSSDKQSKPPSEQTPYFSVTKHERGTESFAEKKKKMPVVDDGAAVEVHRESKAPQTRPPQIRAELGRSGPGEGSWRAVPESVCPFCQNMFSDPEELRIHQRSHLDKRSH